MMEIGLFWTLLLLAGMVTLAVWLVKLLFPTSGVPHRNSRRSNDTLGLVGRPYPAERRDQDENEKPSHGPSSSA